MTFYGNAVEPSANLKLFHEQIAPLLGWMLHPSGFLHWGAYYTDKGGESYSPRYSIHPHHLKDGDSYFKIISEYPEEFVNLGCSTYGEHHLPTARIRATKTPERIAKEIERKICKPYEKLYPEMVNRMQSATDYNATVKTQAEHLAACLQGNTQGIGDPHRNVTVSKSFNLGSTQIEATIYSTSCNWTLSIPHELSRKIAQTIAEHYEAKGAQ